MDDVEDDKAMGKVQSKEEERAFAEVSCAILIPPRLQCVKLAYLHKRQ